MSMESEEFQPIQMPLDAKYCAGLLSEGIMPSAVVGITDIATGNMYAVFNGNRFCGLPIVDLAFISSTVPAEERVRIRLRKRYHFSLPRDIVRVLPLESKVSPYMEDIGNRNFSNIHHRIFYPMLGSTSTVPEGNWVQAIPLNEIPESIACGSGGEVLYQMIDIHRAVARLSLEHAL